MNSTEITEKTKVVTYKGEYVIAPIDGKQLILHKPKSQGHFAAMHCNHCGYDSDCNESILQVNDPTNRTPCEFFHLACFGKDNLFHNNGERRR